MQTSKPKAETLREEIARRSGTARLAWQKLTRKKPVELGPITSKPTIR
jgi:hypothetical protein